MEKQIDADILFLDSIIFREISEFQEFSNVDENTKYKIIKLMYDDDDMFAEIYGLVIETFSEAIKDIKAYGRKINERGLNTQIEGMMYDRDEFNYLSNKVNQIELLENELKQKGLLDNAEEEFVTEFNCNYEITKSGVLLNNSDTDDME